MEELIKQAAKWIKSAKYVVAFTGAGISVESGIAPFRGEKGLWNEHDPKYLEIDYFLAHPSESWQLIKSIFFDTFAAAEPNPAHLALAKLEDFGYLHSIITQNIDNLHHMAGSKRIREFHGNSRQLICINCREVKLVDTLDWQQLPPLCANCDSVLKPDFIFFGEGIPQQAADRSFADAEQAEVMIIIGSTGEVFPAASLPELAKSTGAKIIEINPAPSNFTQQITDIFLQGNAAEITPILVKQSTKTKNHF